MGKVLAILLWCFFMAVSGLLSGCESAEVNPGVPVKYVVGASKSDKTAALEEEGLTVIRMRGREDSTGAIASVISKFNEQDENLYVQFDSFDSDLYDVFYQFMLMHNSGDTDYDLLLYDIPLNSDFASRGFITQLDSYIEESGIKLNEYLPNSIKAATYEENLYSLPVSVGISMLYFRRDIIDAAPLTWDELMLFSKNKMDGGLVKNGFIMSGDASFDSMYLLLETLVSFGVQLFDSNGYPAIDRPKAAKALEKYKELYRSSYVPANIGYLSSRDADNAFAKGDSLMILGLPSGWGHYKGLNSKVAGKFAVAPIPKVEAYAEPNHLLTGTLGAINAKSQNINGAWECLRYLVGEASQKTLAINGCFSPSLIDIYDDAELRLENAHFTSSSYQRALQNADVLQISSNSYKCMVIIRDRIAEYLTGYIDIDITLDKIDRELLEAIENPLAQ